MKIESIEQSIIAVIDTVLLIIIIQIIMNMLCYNLQKKPKN